MKQDFSRKFAVIVNCDVEPWQAMNGLGHVAAYLGNKIGQPFDTNGDFVTRDRVGYPKNSQYSLIVLRAHAGQMPNTMAKARESGLLYHAFIEDMLENDDIEVQRQMDGRDDASTNYFAIGIFGPNEAVDAITKKFQLWR